MKRILVIVCVTALSLVGAVPAFADEGESAHQYLALGDSVAFGYTPPAVTPLGYSHASNFVGYPEKVAPALALIDVNTSCPGEATGGFISLASTDDNGCLTGYRLHFPLHVDYTTSQLDYALQFVKAHRSSLKLVTINIGANDVFHFEKLCGFDATCIANGLPGVLATNQANLEYIFGALRAAGYHNKIVALTYYALDYGPAGAAGTIALNQPMINAANAFHVRIASGFDAFKPLALANGGSSCAAGLIIALPAAAGGGCDVHPTQLGHALLAAAILSAIEGD